MKKLLEFMSNKLNDLKSNEIKEKAFELSNKAKEAIDDINIAPLMAKGKEIGEKVSDLSGKAKNAIDDVTVESMKAQGKGVAGKISNLRDSAQSKINQIKVKRKESIERKIKEKEWKQAEETRRKEEEERRRKEEEREEYEKLSIIEKMFFKFKKLLSMLFSVVLLGVFVVVVFSTIAEYFNETIEESTKSTKITEDHSEVVKTGVYYVKVDVLEVRLSPSSSGSITNRLYRRQKLDVYEVKNGWARVSRYYDGGIEGKSGQVARWVHTSGLSSEHP